MPAVTVTRIRSFVQGSRRKVVAFVNIAADSDFLDVGNIMHIIEGIAITPDNSTESIGATTSQGTAARLTFRTAGGAQNNVHVELTGQ